jgi:hypothetical protein
MLRDTVPQDFLGSLATIVLPSGKIIYANELGRYGTRLTQVADVPWTHYDPSNNNVIETVVVPSGTITNPISNSFVGKYDKLAYVEIDQTDGTTVRALLNSQNFDSAALEALPSKYYEDAVASSESSQANELPWYQQLAYVGVGIAVVFGIAKLSKK